MFNDLFMLPVRLNVVGMGMKFELMDDVMQQFALYCCLFKILICYYRELYYCAQVTIKHFVSDE